MEINLSPEPEIMHVDKKYLLYIESLGPFMKTAPKAWQTFWASCRPIMKTLPIDRMVGLSRIDSAKTDDTKFIYQAGVFLKSKPDNVPSELKLREFAGGKYAKFLLKGSYHQLAQAYPIGTQILAAKKMQLRDDFYAEIYVNTPEDTKEADLKTEILFPVL